MHTSNTASTRCNVVALDERRPSTHLRLVARELREASRANVLEVERGNLDAVGPGDFVRVRGLVPQMLAAIDSLESRGLIEDADLARLVCALVEGEPSTLESLAETAARTLDRVADHAGNRSARGSKQR